MAKITKIIHFIWAGGNKLLPGPNMENIHAWLNQHPEFEIWIWVDKTSYITSQPSISSPPSASTSDTTATAVAAAVGTASPSAQSSSSSSATTTPTPNQPSLVKHPLFTRYQQVFQVVYNINITQQTCRIKLKDIEEEKVTTPCIRYEIDRLTPNYGASSDMLRYQILWKFGGGYFDSDIRPGSSPLTSLQCFDTNYTIPILYIDPHSQETDYIGNDVFICTPNNFLFSLMCFLAEAHYKVSKKEDISITDGMLQRNITSEAPTAFHPCSMEVYNFDDEEEKQRLTPKRTGPGIVRAVVANYYNKLLTIEKLNISQQKIILELPSMYRQHMRDQGCQWLLQESNIFNPSIACSKALNAIRFEVNNSCILRLDYHLTTYLNHIPLTGNSLEIYQLRTSTIQSFLQQLDQVKIPVNTLKAIELTFRYSETLIWYQKNMIDLRLSFQYIYTQNCDSEIYAHNLYQASHSCELNSLLSKLENTDDTDKREVLNKKCRELLRNGLIGVGNMLTVIMHHTADYHQNPNWQYFAQAMQAVLQCYHQISQHLPTYDQHLLLQLETVKYQFKLLETVPSVPKPSLTTPKFGNKGH